MPPITKTIIYVNRRRGDYEVLIFDKGQDSTTIHKRLKVMLLNLAGDILAELDPGERAFYSGYKSYSLIDRTGQDMPSVLSLTYEWAPV